MWPRGAAFWKQPETLLPLTKRLLKPDGLLYLFNQSPGWKQDSAAASFARELTAILDQHGFRPEEPNIESLDPAPVVCVSASPL